MGRGSHKNKVLKPQSFVEVVSLRGQSHIVHLCSVTHQHWAVLHVVEPNQRNPPVSGVKDLFLVQLPFALVKSKENY